MLCFGCCSHACPQHESCSSHGKTGGQLKKSLPPDHLPPSPSTIKLANAVARAPTAPNSIIPATRCKLSHLLGFLNSVPPMAVSLNHSARGGIAPPQGGVSIISLRDGIKLLKHTSLSGTVAEVHIFDDSNQALLVGGGERVSKVTQ